MRICISITDDTTAAVVARMAELASVADLFEVRADFVRDLDLAALARARTKPILLTCRSDAEGGRSTDAAARRRLLAEAVALGVDLLDVEARSGFDDVVAAKRGRGLVLSWHDFAATPDDLDAIYQQMADLRPDLVKVVTRACGIADLGRVLAFARRHADATPPLVTFAMGPEGVASRILGGRFGAPFTFASPANGLEAAPGQIPARVMAETVPRPRDLVPRPASTASWAATSCAASRPRSTTAPSRSWAGTPCTCRCRRSRSAGFLLALPDLALSRLQRHAPVQAVDPDRARGV